MPAPGQGSLGTTGARGAPEPKLQGMGQLAVAAQPLVAVSCGKWLVNGRSMIATCWMFIKQPASR